MNTIHRNPNERGSAILLVLGFLSLLLMMAMIFATTSRNAQLVADAKADETNAQLQARSAITQAQETVFFLQNKGNIIGSVNDNLENCLPENADIDQSPAELEFYYHDEDSVNSDHLGLQPYVGYTTNDLPNSWRFLAFYGELSKDAFSTKPFEISTDYPYQSIYYSHATEDAAADFDEVEAQGNNSLYEIVKATKLGNLYFEAAGSNFEKLLYKDTTKTNPNEQIATQLQFRNFFEADEEDSSKKHVFSRQGFIMFNEGSKFDVNRLVSPGMASDSNEPYVPYVGGNGTVDEDLGALTLGEPGSGLNIDVTPGCSTFAIMGRDYTAATPSIFTSIDEDLTVQYGLHPAELQTRIVSDETVYEDALNRQDPDKAPRWFSYEHMLDDTAAAAALDDDIFTLAVESGQDDRELRFNGQYASMTELLASIGALQDTDGDGSNDSLTMTSGKINSLDSNCSYLAKTNIAYPWGVYCSGRTSSCPTFGCANPTWDDISSAISTVSTKNALNPYVRHFFTDHLGLKYEYNNHDYYLFKDGSDDQTPQVFANLVDFCDSDNEVTCCAEVGGSKLTFGTASLEVATASVTAPTPTIGVPEICGNEKTPAVVGVKVDFDVASTTNVNLSTETRNGSISIPFIGSISIPGMCAMTVSSGNAEFTPSITLSLQNFFGEELPSTSRNYRVIVEGKICPFILARQSSISYDHGIKRKYKNYLLIGGSTTLIPYGSENTDPTSLTDYGVSEESMRTNPTSLVVSSLVAQARYFRVDKTMTHSGSFPECENFLLSDGANTVQYPITGGTYGTTSASLSGNHYFHTGSGYAVKITKIVVMGQEGTSGLSELAYMENPNEDWIVNYNLLYDAPDDVSNCSFSFPIESGGFVATDGATCRDPRMNHKTDQWMWMAGTPVRPTSSVSVSYGQRRLTRGYDSTTFAKYSMETVEDALKNDDPDDDKDWEPNFNPGNMSISNPANPRSTMDTTISTYYIPNSPISSLWQLGAIHRGTEGQTINLKAFGTNSSGTITHEYADGDAWILDYLKLNELDANHGIRGKFNPNCFNAGAYRFLFANIPSNEDAKETMIYANGFYDPETEVQRNTYFRDFIGGTAPATYVDLEDTVFSFNFTTGAGKTQAEVENILASQSWSPVQAFFNFVNVNGGGSETVECNDRQAESLIGCTAGLLSTRYEVFTAIAVGQSVKFLMSEAEMNEVGAEGSAERDAFLKQCANPIRISFKQGTDNFYEWYSILSTQVREVTFVRDCWFGKITVLKSRLL